MSFHSRSKTRFVEVSNFSQNVEGHTFLKLGDTFKSDAKSISVGEPRRVVQEFHILEHCQLLLHPPTP